MSKELSDKNLKRINELLQLISDELELDCEFNTSTTSDQE